MITKRMGGLMVSGNTCNIKVTQANTNATLMLTVKCNFGAMTPRDENLILGSVCDACASVLGLGMFTT